MVASARDVAVALGLVDHHARGLVGEPSHLVSDRLSVPEALGIFQVKPEIEVILDGQCRAKAGS